MPLLTINRTFPRVFWILYFFIFPGSNYMPYWITSICFRTNMDQSYTYMYYQLYGDVKFDCVNYAFAWLSFYQDTNTEYYVASDKSCNSSLKLLMCGYIDVRFSVLSPRNTFNADQLHLKYCQNAYAWERVFITIIRNSASTMARQVPHEDALRCEVHGQFPERFM